MTPAPMKELVTISDLQELLLRDVSFTTDTSLVVNKPRKHQMCFENTHEQMHMLKKYISSPLVYPPLFYKNTLKRNESDLPLN